MTYVRTYRRKDGTIVRGHYRKNNYNGALHIKDYSTDICRYKQREQLANVHLKRVKNNYVFSNNVSRSIIDMLKNTFSHLFKIIGESFQDSDVRSREILIESEQVIRVINNKEAIGVLEDMPSNKNYTCKEMVDGYQRLVNILYQQIKDLEVIVIIRNRKTIKS